MLLCFVSKLLLSQFGVKLSLIGCVTGSGRRFLRLFDLVLAVAADLVHRVLFLLLSLLETLLFLLGGCLAFLGSPGDLLLLLYVFLCLFDVLVEATGVLGLVGLGLCMVVMVTFDLAKACEVGETTRLF